ncbi:hypothetical protein ACLMJK_005148 [Lecanora helva]
MSMFKSAPKPSSLLGYHRILSPSAGVKVSPICLGGISIGNTWRELFGKNDDPFQLLDKFYGLEGNFIDTSNTYNSESSERLIGDWMANRGVRDQMVIATKYSAGYRAYNREQEPMQSNFTGNSAKSMRVSVDHSLQKLQTSYVDILYVHWWDFATSVEEVMRSLHVLVMAEKVLYLGVSDTPAWVVVKANAYARQHGLTPFSVYQGRWNAAYRDMEAEVIPMCEDQGMAIVPWAALGGGQLMTAKQREQKAHDPDARGGYGASEIDVRVSEVLERISEGQGTTLQAVALAYLFQQSTFVFPVVGVQTSEHVAAMPDALRIKLSEEDIQKIHEAAPLNPLFPMDFLFNFRKDQPYNLNMTAADNQQYQMASIIDAPPKRQPYRPHLDA